MALLLCGCIRLDCEPSGRILWGVQTPDHFGVTSMVDGVMGGVTCCLDWGTGGVKNDPETSPIR